MKDTTLLRLSIVSSLIGILLLIYISENITPQINKISSISHDDINKDVRITGKITSSKISSNVMLLTLNDGTSSIKVVAFEPDGLKINSGIEVEVQGKVSLYKNELEIIADKIKSL